MEKLLEEDNHQQLKSQNQLNRLRVKRNSYKNALLLHSTSKLHKLSRQLFKLKIIKSNNRTTAQFFSTTCYRRLKISKRRRQFNLIRVAILILLSILVYLYWHRTFSIINDSSNSSSRNKNRIIEKGEYLKNSYHETVSNSLDNLNLDTINPKQIDHLLNDFIKDEKKFNNQQKNHNRNFFRKEKNKEKDLEFQHLFSSQSSNNKILSKKSNSSFLSNRTNNDRSPTTYLKLITNEKKSKNISTNIKFNNKEIKKIQNNDQKHKKSFVSFSSSNHNSINEKSILPAHISKSKITYPFKNITYLAKPNSNGNLVSKSNQSYSIVSIEEQQQKQKYNKSGNAVIYNDRKNINSKSILEKQLAWYELVGITMFNLLGSSSLTRQNLNYKKLNSNNSDLKINRTSNVETVLVKPISSNYLSTSKIIKQQQQHLNNYNDDHHLNKIEKSKTTEAIKNNNLTLNLKEDEKKQDEILKQRLPQCIIIGVRKAGTRAVLEYLSLNEQIKKADNEIHFFDNDESYSLGLEHYRNQMPFSARGQYTIEKSPAYFVTSTVPERIKAMNSSIKLILIVKDPVVRLISDYTQLSYNKLLKMDDLMRTSGLNKQQQHQYSKQKEKIENHLFEFPIDKENRKFHLESKEKSTNEQFVDVDKIVEKNNLDVHNNMDTKLIEKITSSIGDNNIERRRKKQTQQHLGSDYWNKNLGSELDYRKQDPELELDEETNLNEQNEQDNITNSLSVKHKLRSILMNKNDNWPLMFKNLKKQKKSIDYFKIEEKIGNRIIDSNSKLKNNKKIKKNKNLNRTKDRIKNIETGNLKKSILKREKKINKQIKDVRFNIEDDDDKIKNTTTSNNDNNNNIDIRIRREIILNQNNQNNQNIEQETDDEDDIYKTYKEAYREELNLDDEDIELDDYLNSLEKYHHNKKQQQQQQNYKQKLPTSQTETIKSKIEIKKEKIKNKNDEYLKIPRFEDLVIRNGEINTNYKPVKTSIYSLYIDNWLRVFNRDQIHIVNGDRLIFEPHVELNKIETFLGLPNQIQASHFVFNKKKNFYCAKISTGNIKQQLNSQQSLKSPNQILFSKNILLTNSNSSTSWHRMARNQNKNSTIISKNKSLKTTGRHSSIRCLNSSKGRPHPQVDKQVIIKLRQFYAPFNRHFERMVGETFNWPEL